MRPRPAKRRPRSPADETNIRILDTAERLFAAGGIEGVSVRAVLAEAGINVALAHYHFGSRDGLIEAVLRRRVVPLNDERARLLQQAQARGSSCSIEEVLRASYEPMLRLLYEEPDFARLVGHVYSSPNQQLRAGFESLFAESTVLFADAFRPLLPAGLSPVQRLCRATFLAGMLVYTLTRFDDVRALSRSRGHSVPALGELLDEFVVFGAAGIRASSDAQKDRRRR